MNRDQIEELAVSYSNGELDGEELAKFQAWRAGATAEELLWFSTIVDTAGELAMSEMKPVDPPPELKGKLMSQLGLDGDSSEDPDFSFIMGADSEADWIELPVPGARMKVLSDCCLLYTSPSPRD